MFKGIVVIMTLSIKFVPIDWLVLPHIVEHKENFVGVCADELSVSQQVDVAFSLELS